MEVTHAVKNFSVGVQSMHASSLTYACYLVQISKGACMTYRCPLHRVSMGYKSMSKRSDSKGQNIGLQQTLLVVCISINLS